MTLQKKIEQLVSAFTREVLRAVAAASLDEVVGPSKGRPERRVASAPATARPEARVTAPRAKPEAPRPERKVSRRSARPMRPEILEQRIEDQLLRQLRSGMLLSPDELFGMISLGRTAPRQTRATLQRLVDRGLVEITGEGADRLVFARRTPKAASTSTPRATPSASPLPIEDRAEAPEATAEAAPISQPTAKSDETPRHPFVVRRKRAANAT